MGVFRTAPAYTQPDLAQASSSTRRDSAFPGVMRRESAFPGAVRRDSAFPGVTRRESAAPGVGAGAGRRRSSILPAFLQYRPSVAEPRDLPPPLTTLSGPNQQSFSNTQTTFLGRKLSTAFVPAFARKASLAVAQQDRDPTHLRLGETDTGGEHNLNHAFYHGRLSLDDWVDEDEKLAMQNRLHQLRQQRDHGASGEGSGGKHTHGWQAKLGWQAAPPMGRARTKRERELQRDESGKKARRHRNKRAMRAMDSDLDAYNAYAQNGLTPLTREKSGNNTLGGRPASVRSGIYGSMPSRNANQSSTSLQSSIYGASLLAPPTAEKEGSILSLDTRPRAVPVGDGFDALDVMADHIFHIGVQRKKWFKPPKMGVKRDGVATGVTVRAKTGLYRTYPVDYEPLEEFEEAISRLNPEVAIKIDSQIVRNVMRAYINPFPSMSELIIDENTRIQILDEVSHLGRARKHQYAAFVRSENVLVVWADMAEFIIPAGEALEDALIQFIWRGEEENKKVNQAIRVDEAEKEDDGNVSVKEEDLDPEDVEIRRLKRRWRERPTMLIAPCSDGIAIMLVMTTIALGLRTLVAEWTLDGKIWRFGLFAFAPFLICIATFACMVLVGSFWQTFGPVRQCTQNSVYYSGVAPKRTMGTLSHVTVQMPVYKESLDEVIRPTIESLKRAITTYERQGGSCSIVICDDGLQLLPPAEVQRRKTFYHDNNIAYVSRPGHNVNGFIRKGRFKKAGNMNYCNALSLRVEEIMDERRPGVQATKPADAWWGDTEENELYDQCLAAALEEKKGEAWASGNIRMGSIILIIDSDTRVPEDCFADAVSEMAESPEVAIIQHSSGVMQVAHHFFENGVAHFTRGIQTSISYCCASGEVAPFVGHNAFLRWSALQECMFVDPDDGISKIWSEDHVSEDFQIAVTLQVKGYIVRWASYSGGEFEEGVSLTCDDELNRWQKYAFGCSELLFFPFKKWITRGPITPLFRKFVWSNIPLHSKFTISGYIFSYYAIACAWSLTIMNYFLQGWNVPLDGYYLTSWNITLACLIIFVGISNVSFITLRYRLKLPNAMHTAFEQIKWIPFFSIFFTGMSMPMSAALVSHLVGYNMTWSTTIKTVEKSNFFLQIPIIWRRFWPQLTLFTTMMVGMIVMAVLPQIPPGWKITATDVLVPTALITATHLLYPFALNPWFLSFSF